MVLYLGSLGASYAPRNIPVFPLPACGCAGAAASGAETSARRSARWKGRMPILFAPAPRLAILDLGPTQARTTSRAATLDLEPIPPPRHTRRESTPWLDQAADGPRRLRPSWAKQTMPRRGRR